MKNTTLVCLFLFALSISGQCLGQSKADDRAVRLVLDQQTVHWNNGNIDAFMEGYWKSDSLAFIGAKGPNYGWATTRDGYKTRYPDRATMGKLQFTILRLDLLASNVAFVIGKWHLTRPEKGDVGGHFTLVFKKVNGQWVIISDHTS